MTETARTGNDRTRDLLELAKTVKGFMPEDEGEALFEAVLRIGTDRRSAANGSAETGATVVEIGAWCGKSTVYLGAACEATGAVLFSIDHHHGSEENQAGWDHHDRQVVDPETKPNRHLAVLASDDRHRTSRRDGGGYGRRLPHDRRALGNTCRLLLHRRGARKRTGVGRLLGLVAQG